MKHAWSGITLAVFFARAASAQAATPLSFEAASVQSSPAGTAAECGFLPEGRFECRGATILRLVALAYDITTARLLGGPGWLSTDRFDVTAKAASRRASPAALREMLQMLLADRFGLAVHRDRKEMPVYLLEVSKTGAKLQPPAGADPPACPKTDGKPGWNHRDCRAYSMADLSALLPQIAQSYVDRPVVDATGLEGGYDFPLDWMSKTAYLGAQAKNQPGVSMFDTLAALGLKLDPGFRPVPVIVVDRVNRTPSPDKSNTVPTEFDVAEVRPGKPARPEELRALPDGQLEIRGYTLRELLTIAFEVKGYRIAGAPQWLDEDRYDVIAKSPAVMSPHALSRMLKTLLVRRFQLQTHTAEQPVPVFALVPGKHAPKLKESGDGARSECRLSFVEAGRSYTCRNTTLAELAQRLPNVAQAYLTRPLVNLTGLKGTYDFTLTWTPKGRLPAAAPWNGDIGQPATQALQEAAPGGDLTLFEAIDRQLGLKVVERKHPMPVIVIDRVARITSAND